MGAKKQNMIYGLKAERNEFFLIKTRRLFYTIKTERSRIATSQPGEFATRPYYRSNMFEALKNEPSSPSAAKPATPGRAHLKPNRISFSPLKVLRAENRGELASQP